MSTSPNRKQSLAWIGILCVLAASLWFGSKSLRDAEATAGGGPAAGGRPPSTVIFQLAEKKEMVQMLTVTGTLRAVRRAEVAARESAAVESMTVDEGDLVKEGRCCGTLDGRRLEAQLQEAEAALTAARAELAQREAEHERATQTRK